MRIDTHSHWVPPKYAALLEASAAANSGFAAVNARRLESISEEDSAIRRLDLRLEEMETAGIDVSVLSLPPPGVTFDQRSGRLMAAITANNELIDAAETYPDSFVVIGNLPFPDTDEALRELHRLSEHPAVRGISVHPAEAWTVEDDRNEPVYEAIASFGLPIVLHPNRRAWPADWQDWGLTRSLGAMVTSSLAAGRLILSGLLDRVPKLEVLMPHLGGTLPYLLQRFEDVGQGVAEHEVGHYLRHRFVFDTCSLLVPAMHFMVEVVGVERLVMGTDYPVRGPLQRMVDHIHEALPDERERELVLGVTAARWFDPKQAGSRAG